MSHQNEYHDAMVTVLELIWGEGFMAPGGPRNVHKMIEGLQLRGKRVLDIGCGLGGPAMLVAEEAGASVLGIDLEVPLIARAQERAQARGLAERVEFRTVAPGPLPCADDTFDLVMSSGALTQTEDKLGMFGECLRVLKPGGVLSCYDWMKSAADYSQDMLYWFEMEGLTYAMCTLAQYRQLMEQAGFEDVRCTDASEWYRHRVAEEYQKLSGPLYPRMLELIGKDDAEHFVENWRAMLVVCEKGEMRQGYCRGRKPL